MQNNIPGFFLLAAPLSTRPLNHSRCPKRGIAERYVWLHLQMNLLFLWMHVAVGLHFLHGTNRKHCAFDEPQKPRSTIANATSECRSVDFRVLPAHCLSHPDCMPSSPRRSWYDSASTASVPCYLPQEWAPVRAAFEKVSEKECALVVVTVVFRRHGCLKRIKQQLPQTCAVAIVDNVSTTQPGWSDQGWRVFIVEPSYLPAKKSSKIPKTLAEFLFPNAVWSVYLDIKILLTIPPGKLVRNLLSHGATFASKIHKHFCSAIEEYEMLSKKNRKEDPAVVRQQLGVYAKDGWSGNHSRHVNAELVVRKHGDPCNQLLSCLWYNEVALFSSRVQLSFSYVYDMLGLQWRRPTIMRLIEEHSAVTTKWTRRRTAGFGGC